MAKKRILASLLAFSALVICILPHCRLRDWCGNLQNDSGYVVCRLDQSASFRIFDSAFYPLPKLRAFCTAYNTAVKTVSKLAHNDMFTGKNRRTTLPL